MKRLVFLCLLTFSLSALAAELGRLFFTPAERARLNELRANAKTVELVDQTNPEAVEVVTPPSDVSVQGYVKRSDGKKSTVWVNGQPVQEGSRAGGVDVGKLQGGSNQVPLTLSGSGKSVKLKAGQLYDPANDQITDVKASRNQEKKGDAEPRSVLEEGVIPAEVLEQTKEPKRN